MRHSDCTTRTLEAVSEYLAGARLRRPPRVARVHRAGSGRRVEVQVLRTKPNLKSREGFYS